MKKLLTVFLVMLVLFGCSSKEDNKEDRENKYIKPINVFNYYENLNDSLKDKLKTAYGDSDVDNNLIEMIGLELKDMTAVDYYGNPVYFRDLKQGKTIFEIVQYTCEHCKKQVPLTEQIMSKADDVTFVQFFAYGDIDQIDTFYDEAGQSIPKNVIVIPENKELSNYFMGIGVDATPTFLFYEDGVVKFCKVAELSYAQFLNAYNVSYINSFTKKDLTTNEGKSVFEGTRTYDDVLNDLSTASKDKLALIDNSEELTINNIGKFVEFYSLYEEDENGALYKLDSYTQYVNKPLVVFYLGNINDNMKGDILLINNFVDEHPDINVLTLLMDTKDVQTSETYQNMDIELKGDFVSSNAEIPKQFIDTKVGEYLAALFIQDNTFVGGVSGIKTLDTVNRAYDTFIGGDSIALVKNNVEE